MRIAVRQFLGALMLRKYAPNLPEMTDEGAARQILCEANKTSSLVLYWL